MDNARVSRVLAGTSLYSRRMSHVIVHNILAYAAELGRHPMTEYLANSVGPFAARCMPGFCWLGMLLDDKSVF